MTIALFIGRFQPLHNGHAAIIKEIASKCDVIKIGIGSAQLSHTKDNPLSAEERTKMLKLFLHEAQITNVKIYLIPDINNDTLWVQHVMNIVGSFDVVYSGNPLVIRLFQKKKIMVKRIDEIHPYKATRTRTAVRQSRQITQDVPPIVLKYLERIDALERIKKCG